MKSFILCLALFASFTLQAQSKKEMAAELSKLKAEIADLKKPKEPNLTDKHKKASYGLGVLVATNLKTQGGDSLDTETIAIAINDVFKNNPLKMDQQECMNTVQQYMTEAMEVKSKELAKESDAFMLANKTKEGVKVTASGLQYKVISSGKGKTPTATDQVTVHYTGKLMDGTVFDSSVERNEPAVFGVSDVIQGWTEVLQLMHEGDKWIVFIPHSLGYGERGGGPIPPYATLIFELELLKVN